MARPYTVASHLHYFNIPLADFTAARPEFESFAVGGYIFARHDPAKPRILLLQRAITDTMGGCWEGPGGASEPESDKTLLDGVVREVLEETGLHVSRIVDLVAVDSWQHLRRNRGDMLRIAKYSFIVDVYEGELPREQIPVRLEASEHQAFEWAVEEEVRRSMQGSGRYQLPLPPTGHQGPNILRSFAWCKEQAAKSTKESL
ncbi:hypothetical protein N7532_004873 [Penicillium argentinense]|uniref:Nudix hydrolase domain-containing protein n=1 Tax=Penicillium argentinense TaxID=1131581 RepID=A0A9W9FCZ1_9EURO|nr:uncharacterized protein N7532_004873 [Penicillium argentinense]KAJ5097872.1 hypothetical protein N7532_004873 [Penicillium argentinense]